MSDKKHIDRLFQERLKDLDVTPPPKVWGDLEAKLKKQNKPKRAIPIWWRASGVAALLLLFFALGNFIYNSTITNTPSRITDTPISKSNDSVTKTSIVSSDDDTVIEETQQQKKDHPHLVDEKTNTTQIVNQTNKKTIKNAAQIGIKYNTKTFVVATNKSDKPSESKDTTKYNANTIVSQNPKVYETSKTEIDSKTKGTSNTNSNAIVSQEQDTVRTPKSDTASEIILAESTPIPDHAKTAPNNTESPSETSLGKTSILDTLSIEHAIAATKNGSKTDEKSKKWDIRPNVAPVYYSNTGKGSHLDDQFVNNSKTGEINTSYGVAVGYALNTKLKIRSGVNNLNLSFNTNDVILFQNSGADMKNTSNLEHVSATNQTENLSFFSVNKVASIQNSTLISSNENNAINQSISYFEVPLELEYTILNKRIGINLIGGFSTFILGDNSVYSKGQNSRTYIGEATNINDISFSTNFGVGFDYNFSNRFNFNLEPTLKYQLNAYNNVSGSFKPYIIGVYTGFSYKF